MNVFDESEAGDLEQATIGGVKVEELSPPLLVITKSGTILVDGVLASAYGHPWSHDVTHAIFAPLRALHTLAPKFFVWMHGESGRICHSAAGTRAEKYSALSGPAAWLTAAKKVHNIQACE